MSGGATDSLSSRTGLSDGTLLAGTAAFGPACAYLFELGYGARFDIATGLVALDATDSAGMTILVFVVVGCYFVLLEGVAAATPRFLPRARRLLAATPSVVVLGLSVWHFAARAVNREWDWLALGVITLMIVVVAYSAQDENSIEATIAYPRVGPRRLSAFIAVGSSVLLLYFAYRSGFIVASTQQWFQMTDSEHAILRIYGSKMITARVSHNQILGPLKVESVD